MVLIVIIRTKTQWTGLQTIVERTNGRRANFARIQRKHNQSCLKMGNTIAITNAKTNQRLFALLKICSTVTNQGLGASTFAAVKVSIGLQKCTRMLVTMNEVRTISSFHYSTTVSKRRLVKVHGANGLLMIQLIISISPSLLRKSSISNI